MKLLNNIHRIVFLAFITMLVRTLFADDSIANLVTNADLPYTITSGLQNRHIALWGSHGKYYNKTKALWQWQRPRLMMTCEDLYSSSYVLPYLAPMLENAGANVMMPRERDVHSYGFIIDSHKTSESSYSWSSHISESGDYAVYVSYEHNDKNTSAAEYTIYHAGGSTKYVVNQRIGGYPWVYLGTHHFNVGNVVIRLRRTEGVVAGSIKIGGGIGQSGFPQFAECARYWLEAAKVPYYVYGYKRGENDYTDDLYSRGRWVNYLSYGEQADTLTKGLGIPIDLAFAFHTDAGVRLNDSIVGTLVIMTDRNSKNKRILANGMNRMTSMSLADSVQTQICHDLRSLHTPEWTRRKLHNKSYCETRVPEVPCMLLELLSHQNFSDMRYGLDPQFRFDVSRAIYKGIVKYLAARDSIDYTIQPLPVKTLGCFLNNDTLSVEWKPSNDTLESSATPDYYVLYTRHDDSGFDNGVIVKDTSYRIVVQPGIHYQFMVRAGNAGGVSMPSPVISASMSNDNKGVALVINAFDRISAPESFNFGERIAGFVPNDYGMPDRLAFHFVGQQYDYVRDSQWLDNDAPGFGASYGDMEGKLIAGNTFDYAYLHGKQWAENKYSYVSCSADAISWYNTITDSTMMSGNVRYKAVDVIFGEQKTIATGLPTDSVYRHQCYTADLVSFLTNYATLEHGNIIISGAHIGSELNKCVLAADSSVIDFAANILHYKGHNDHASRSAVVINDPKCIRGKKLRLSYTNTPNDKIYHSINVDCIYPVNASTLLRYEDSGQSAATIYKGDWQVCAAGFPFETITNINDYSKLMQIILNQLNL